METPKAPKKEAMLLIETQHITRTQVITALSVFAFSLCIVFLFLQHKTHWLNEYKEATKGLQAENEAFRKQIAEYRTADSLRQKFIFNSYFDSKDEKNFRLYGLFKSKDTENKTSEIAKRFHVPAKAIQVQEFEKETWYIVPIKAIHWVKPSETPESIAKLYYFDKNDVRLIKEFNPKFENGSMVYIPFN